LFVSKSHNGLPTLLQTDYKIARSIKFSLTFPNFFKALYSFCKCTAN
jgi:hypothetical protein